MKITVITYRTAQTLGDTMGAYRSIQALCKNLATEITVDFVIFGESKGLQGLTNIVQAPNDRVNFNTHLFDMEKAYRGLAKGFKAKGFFLGLASWSLSALNNRLTRCCGIEKLLGFLGHKECKFDMEIVKKFIMNVFSEETTKDSVSDLQFMGSDLILIYNSPDLFLSLLHVYSENPALQLQQKAWFVSEYNGGDANYQGVLEQIRAYPKPQNVEVRMFMTGFPNTTAPEPIIGVFADKQEPPALTENDENLLRSLGYNPAQTECPALFFGYTNYSLNGKGDSTRNPRINLEFFADIAIKQYLAFNPANQSNEIDIMAPFNKAQCKKIVSQVRAQNPHISFEIIFLAKKDKSLQRKCIPGVAASDKKIVVRLINIFPLKPGLFKWCSKRSRKLTMRTGDQSYIEAILDQKVPLFYEMMVWKTNYYQSFLDFLSALIKSREPSANLRPEELLEHYKSNGIGWNFVITSLGSMDFGIGNTDAVKKKKLEIDSHLKKLAEIAIDPVSFQCMAEFFQ
ncbi:MAG TPA: hypothetical protein VGU44_03535, partial [Gammaproteobacteria bacterium]|nr:hypothetical protein [Gammaproteobacteria bacterium]